MGAINNSVRAFSANGRFLTDGRVIFGNENQRPDPANPGTLKQIFTDAALSTPALNPQPLDSDAKFEQGGATGTLYGSGTYSYIVLDSNGVETSYVPSFTVISALTAQEAAEAAEAAQAAAEAARDAARDSADSINVPAGTSITLAIPTIVNLRALEPAFDNQQIELLGHTNDGIGAGIFYADFSDTTSTDNNGTVIVTPNGRRWKRRLEGFVTPYMFGVIPNSATDYTTQWQAAINTGLPVRFGIGTHIVRSLQRPSSVPGQTNPRLRIYGENLRQSIIECPNDFTGYMLDVNGGGYDIRNIRVNGRLADGVYGLGSSVAGSSGGEILQGADFRNFDEAVYFSDEYNHFLGIDYDDVYIQGVRTSGINFGDDEGAADSGESALDFSSVIVTNNNFNDFVQYTSTTTPNTPNNTHDRITWTDDNPKFGVVVIRSADGSTNWEIVPNIYTPIMSGNTFDADKTAGQTWTYRVIRTSIGVNLRRIKAINLGAIQTEYFTVGTRVKECEAVNCGALYSENRDRAGFGNPTLAGFLPDDSASVTIDGVWVEQSEYAVLNRNNSKTIANSISASACRRGAIGNGGSTNQSVSFDNVTLSNSTPEVIIPAPEGIAAYIYEGKELTTGENKRVISHQTKATSTVAFRGDERARMEADSMGGRVIANQMRAAPNAKSQVEPLKQTPTSLTTALVDNTATGVYTFNVSDNSYSCQSVSVSVVVRDTNSVIRQASSAMVNLTVLRVPGLSVITDIDSIQTKTQQQGTLSDMAFSLSESNGVVTLSVDVDTSLSNASIRCSISPITSEGSSTTFNQL